VNLTYKTSEQIEKLHKLGHEKVAEIGVGKRSFLNAI